MSTTYIVRTQADQTLMGVFCADSIQQLAGMIDEVFDSRVCEYLALGSNEGLFIEGQFTTRDGFNGEREITITSVDDPELQECGDFDDSDEASALIGEHGADEYIPPVLEPSEGLTKKLQSAHKKGAWKSFSPAKSSTSEQPKKTAPSDKLLNALTKGALSPANFFANASTRHH